MKKKETGISLAVFLINLIFYMIFLVVDGVNIAVDSESYIMGTYGREPLYPILLWMFRTLFGENRYFFWVVLFQCLLAAVAAWRFTMILRKKLEINNFVLIIVIGLQFAVVLLLRFAAKRESTYCNSICSEGIAIPLFTLFISELLLLVWENSNKNLWRVMLYSVCLLSIRKQMYIVLVIMVAVYAGMFIVYKFNVRKCILAAASIIGILLLAVGIDMLYNMIHHGEAMRHTTDSSALVISTFYSSDLEDADYFTDDDMKELFTDIMSQVEIRKYSYKYAQSGWRELYIHYSDNYDLIAFDIVNPAFYNYIDGLGVYTDNEREKMFDDLNHKILMTLLPVKWPQMFKVTMANVLTGLCNTVSKSTKLLDGYNLLFYGLYIILAAWLIIKKKNSCLAWLAFVVLAAAVINVGAVGIMIFAQSRYMIYNMPLMYVTLFLLISEYIKSCYKVKWVKKNQP